MSRETVGVVIDALATLVLLGQGVAIVLAVLFVAQFFIKTKSKVFSFVTQNALVFAFLVAVIATIGSLFLSEIAKFTPCKLCWYQRIFMYPNVLLLGIAFWKNDPSVKRYVLPLSGIGLGIAIRHYILQMFPAYFPCSDELANCAARQFASYGYITIPMMSLTAFLLIFLSMLWVKDGKFKLTTVLYGAIWIVLGFIFSIIS